ncbi:hypothetical protein GCM10023171_18950 [Microbacterium panaciterrae]|uniref:Uncharacterized protein n=1 Tax=Microbacterium panaciterrae TaxID=985759 RepID=A0ABP8PF16_9MICO
MGCSVAASISKPSHARRIGTAAPAQSAQKPRTATNVEEKRRPPAVRVRAAFRWTRGTIIRSEFRKRQRERIRRAQAQAGPSPPAHHLHHPREALTS